MISYGLILIEKIAFIIVGLVALYLSAITYRFSAGAIVLVNIIVGVLTGYIQSVSIQKGTFMSGETVNGIMKEGLAVAIMYTASIVASFIILTSRFGFVETVGILITGSIVVVIINAIIGLLNLKKVLETKK